MVGLPEDWSRPGRYILWMRLSSGRIAEIGRLGLFSLPAGWYAYVGSARGAGGVRARVERHLNPNRHTHWHIDYFLPAVLVLAIWASFDRKQGECEWADLLVQRGGARRIVPGFGASDCRCAGHLLYWRRPPDTGVLEAVLRPDSTWFYQRTGFSAGAE
ncbi:MAG: GIY-YIG nuclease family protein [Anaerolineae bacterium]